MRHRRILALLAGLALPCAGASCFFGDASLAGRACPCLDATTDSTVEATTPAKDGALTDTSRPDADATNVSHDATRLDATRRDAGSGDVFQVDAVGDAHARDAGPVDAAGSDVWFCQRDAQRALTLCADFDEYTSLTGVRGFGIEEATDPQSTVSRSVDASVSPPASVIFATLAELDASGIPVTRLYQDGGTFKTASFAADVRVDRADMNATGYAQLAQVTMGASSLSVEVEPGGWYLQEAYPKDGGTSYKRSPPFFALTQSHWVHVDLEITLDAADGSAGGGSWQVSVRDLATSADGGSNATLDYLGTRPSWVLSIGLTSVHPLETGWTVHFDNVTFDLH